MWSRAFKGTVQHKQCLGKTPASWCWFKARANDTESIVLLSCFRFSKLQNVTDGVVFSKLCHYLCHTSRLNIDKLVLYECVLSVPSLCLDSARRLMSLNTKSSTASRKLQNYCLEVTLFIPERWKLIFVPLTPHVLRHRHKQLYSEI